MILLTGGLGDIFVLESCFEDKQRQATHIYYATPKADQCIEYMKIAMPLAQHIILSKETFAQKHEVFSKIKSVPDDWYQVEDWSIAEKFPCIRKGKLRRYRPAAVRCAFDFMNCPVRFNRASCLIHPATNGKGRQFTNGEWQMVSQYLDMNRLYGVVVNDKPIECPLSKNIVNMSGETTLAESIALLREADYFLGVDSSLSVLASMMKKPENVVIKCPVPSHGHEWRDVYWEDCANSLVRSLDRRP